MYFLEYFRTVAAWAAAAHVPGYAPSYFPLPFWLFVSFVLWLLIAVDGCGWLWVKLPVALSCPFRPASGFQCPVCWSSGLSRLLLGQIATPPPVYCTRVFVPSAVEIRALKTLHNQKLEKQEQEDPLGGGGGASPR